MPREEDGVILIMGNIPEPLEGSVYKPSRKKKQDTYESEKVVQKPPKKKVVHQKEVQKEVQEVASTTVLMPTKTRNKATSKTPQKTTSSNLVVSVKKNKLWKMVL